ncbi:MAG: vWA domain-containing protein [Alloprevotella sp.]
MRHYFLNKHALLAGLSIAALSLSSCLDKGDESIILESSMSQLVADIPSDDMATPNPTVNNPTTTLPNATCSVERNGDGVYVASINMTGVWNEDAEDWLKLYGTAYDKQNVWVSVDGNPKGIDVYNTADGEGARTVSADLVFLVDHSGSMSEEADGLANQVVAWSQKLAQSGLDIRFGCVGYGDSPYSNTSLGGALNLTTATELKTYFDRSYGVSRTKGFYGSDAATLQAKATSGSYNNGSPYAECGMVALRFADDNFAFRNGSNRIYVNFTDEPNQPGGSQTWSVEALKTNIWNTSKGTIHTVWSGGNYTSWTSLRYEDPKLMSTYTGGTSKDVNASFTNVTLDDLPVTGAMQNSYIIRFTNISEFMDGQQHVVKVTVVSNDGKVQAEKEFYVTFGVAE